MAQQITTDRDAFSICTTEKPWPVMVDTGYVTITIRGRIYQGAELEFPQ